MYISQYNKVWNKIIYNHALSEEEDYQIMELQKSVKNLLGHDIMESKIIVP